MNIKTARVRNPILCKLIHSGGSTRHALCTMCDNDYITPFPAVRTICTHRQHKFLNNGDYNGLTLGNDVCTRYPESSVLATCRSQGWYTLLHVPYMNRFITTGHNTTSNPVGYTCTGFLQVKRNPKM